MGISTKKPQGAGRGVLAFAWKLCGAAVLLLLLAGSGIVEREPTILTPTVLKRYRGRIIRVKQNQTLYYVSRRYRITVKKLKEWNHLSTHLIRPGEYLALDKGAADKLKKMIYMRPEPLEKYDMAVGVLDRIALIIFERASKYLGKKYRLGANGGKYIDCSALARVVLKPFAKLPRTAIDMYYLGRKIYSLKPGDLLFFATSAAQATHVAIYIGEMDFVHASSREGKVAISSLSEPFYRHRFIGARRFLN